MGTLLSLSLQTLRVSLVMCVPGASTLYYTLCPHLGGSAPVPRGSWGA